MKNAVLVSLSLSMLLPSLDAGIANVALPTLAAEFGATVPQAQGVVVAYLVSITVSLVGVGRLGDLYGRRRLLIGGILLFTAASAACGAAPTIFALIAARLLQGLGAAVMTSLTVALAGEVAAREKLGSAMGLLGTISAVGTALGPTLGGVLIDAVGWRAVFLVNVPLGALAIVLAARALPASPVVPTVPRRQLLTLMRDRELSMSLLASTLVSAAMMSTLVIGPFYLARELGLDAAMVGLVMSVGPLVAALTGYPAGRSVDRFGTRRMTSFGLGGMALGLIGIAASTRYGVAGYLLPMMLVTASYAMFQGANNTAISRRATAHDRGTIAGLLSLARNLGLLAGASVLGALFAASNMPATYLASAIIISSIGILKFLLEYLRRTPDTQVDA